MPSAPTIFNPVGEGVYNVKNFGAKGNGITDDTAAIQAAITGAVGASGGIVYFPTGTYMVSSTLTIPKNPYTSTIAGPLILRGDAIPQDDFFHVHPFASMLIAKGLAGYLVESPATVFCFCSFENLFLSADTAFGGSQTSGGLLNLFAWQHSWIEHCGFTHAFGRGVNINGASIVNGFASRINHSYFVKCGDYGLAVNNIVQSSLENSYFGGNGAAVVGSGGFFGSINTTYWTIRGNFFEGTSNRGLQAPPSSWVLNNQVITCTHEGIFCSSDKTFIYDNLVVNNGSSGTDPDGIRLYGAHTCVVKGNMSGNTTGTKQAYGIVETTGVSNLILGNHFPGNTTAPVKSTNTGSVYKDNLGYNPVGLVTVAVPATATAVAAAGYDRTFYITASTSTVACAVTDAGGTSQTVATIPSGGFGAVFVPAGSTLTPTYTAAPTWTVQGH